VNYDELDVELAFEYYTDFHIHMKKAMNDFYRIHHSTRDCGFSKKALIIFLLMAQEKCTSLKMREQDFMEFANAVFTKFFKSGDENAVE